MTVEYHHRDSTSWVSDAERWICQIQGVRQCKIDLDSKDEISGVHVVASADREPRHVVRDVEGLLKARLHIDVYYKKIGVVQIVEGPRDRKDGSLREAVAEVAAKPKRAELEPVLLKASTGDLSGDGVHPALLVEETSQIRLECSKVGLSSQGPILNATVELSWGSLKFNCSDSGPDHPGADIALLAKATLKAITQLVDAPITLSLGSITRTELAGDELIVVSVDLAEGRRSERFYGVCSERHNRQQSAVFAVLDALNRRLAFMDLKERI